MATDPFLALLQGGDPIEEQKRMAARLRGEEAMRAMMTKASQEGQGLDILNFVAQNANNKPLAEGMGLLTKARQARHAPMKTDHGIMIPATGEYQANPGYEDEQENNRDTKRLLAMSVALEKQRATEALSASRSEADATKRLLGGLMAQVGFDRNNAMRERQDRDTEKKADKELAKNVRLFSQDQKKNGIPQIADAVKGIHGMLDTPDGKLPGVGYGQDTLAKIPLVSDLSMGAEGKKNRARIQKMINAVMETEAGKNVTANELVRQTIVNMAGDRYSEADFRNAMTEVILPALENIRANSLRGATPEVVDAYMENDGSGYNPRDSFLPKPKAKKGDASKPAPKSNDDVLIDKWLQKPN